MASRFLGYDPDSCLDFTQAFPTQQGAIGLNITIFPFYQTATPEGENLMEKLMSKYSLINEYNVEPYAFIIGNSDHIKYMGLLGPLFAALPGTRLSSIIELDNKSRLEYQRILYHQKRLDPQKISDLQDTRNNLQENLSKESYIDLQTKLSGPQAKLSNTQEMRNLQEMRNIQDVLDFQAKLSDLEKSQLDLSMKQTIVLGIANGIRNLKKHDITLMNLIPDNVYIDEKHAARVDWASIYLGRSGFIKNNGLRERPDQQINIYRYRAPEVLDGEELTATAAADVYSFGCIAYYVFEGKPLWTEQSHFKIVKAKRQGQPPDIVLHNDSPHSKSTAELIRRCVQRNPEDRPTIEQVVEELARIWYNLTPDGTRR
ncbi:MAG: protein kinase [Holosporales bacterium]|jgi:hypothetical protein|nr:protein kinase [Holosporales bacterium]